VVKPYLTGVGVVDWASLEHAYGTADDVPAILKQVAEGTLQEAARPLYQLFGNIHHQGDVYRATVAAIPFLVDIAIDLQVAVRAGTIELLGCIADGVFLKVREKDWFADPPAARARLEAAGATVELACRAGVVEHSARLVGALRTAPPEAQVATFALAADLVEAHPRLAPLVEEQAPAVTDNLAILALELFRAAVTPGPRPAALAVGRALLARGIPDFADLPGPGISGNDSDDEYVASTLKLVMRHLKGTRTALATTDLLEKLSTDLLPVFFRPYWLEYVAIP
jgi:hypothetical protein